ncbi:uncharacterized protein [Chelonus insularis]|uniref:uncharacterized protein n=1 Tax=Chelonus insularis TaxID=460826 RepID=UPI00158AD1D8|nr:uncharacterized protein LOC118067895 [Chelonus insularis]
MMSKKWIVYFLFYLTLKMCVCSFRGYVDFDVSQRKNIKKFPWMVTISDNNEETNFAYGTLIHERAVLTLSIMEINEFEYFHFRVFAECYFPEHVNNFHCLQVRNVSEYNILEQLEDDTEGNLAILILSEAFTLSETVNIIHFARHDTDFEHEKCAIISLRNLESSHGLQLKARLMTSTQVKITLNPDNYLEYRLNLKYDNLTLYNDEHRTEKFNNGTGTHILDFSGGPAVCKSTHTQDRWLLVGVINFAIVIRNNQIEYTTTGEVNRVDVHYIQEILAEIIRRSWFITNNSRPILKIG